MSDNVVSFPHPTMSSTKKIWNTQRPRLSHEVCPETIHVHQTLEKATKISGSLDHGVYAVLLWEIEVYLMLGYDRLPTCRKNMSVLDLKTHLELHTIQPNHPAEPLKHEMRWYYYLDRSYREISGTKRGGKPFSWIRMVKSEMNNLFRAALTKVPVAWRHGK